MVGLLFCFEIEVGNLKKDGKKNSIKYKVLDKIIKFK